ARMGGLAPVLQSFAALYVLILAILGPVLTRESRAIYNALNAVFKWEKPKAPKATGASPGRKAALAPPGGEEATGASGQKGALMAPHGREAAPASGREGAPTASVGKQTAAAPGRREAAGAPGGDEAPGGAGQDQAAAASGQEEAR
ncbi:MAG TPA: hypothetical protein VIK92_09110, partial [Thermaerobacter sp.]